MKKMTVLTKYASLRDFLSFLVSWSETLGQRELAVLAVVVVMNYILLSEATHENY